MLKFNFVPKSANNPFQKLEVKLTSQSETIAFGNPCNLKISFMKIFAMSSVLCEDFTSVKCVAFVNLSTTTMLSPSHWQSCNKIHGNNFPFPLRNWQRLQQACWMLMLNLYLLTFNTPQKLLSHIPLHSWPKVLLSGCSNCLLISWVSRIRSFDGFHP